MMLGKYRCGRIDSAREFFSAMVKSYSNDASQHVWTDGSAILTKDKKEHGAIIDRYCDAGFAPFYSSGYFDPKEDERDGILNDYTGCWWIEFS